MTRAAAFATSQAVTHAATLKIGELARLTGVSVPTIHFYLREGLLPPAPRKTSRNMAYYDPSYVTRIQLIRRLQDERRLPLRVIRSMLSELEAGDEGVLDLVQAQARLMPMFARVEPGAEVDRAALIESTGVDLADLDDLEQVAVVTPRGSGKRARYSPEDQAVVAAVARVRSLGLGPDVFPASDLALYQRAISALVGEETRLFARRMRGAKLEFGPGLEGAIVTLGEIIVQLRQKLIADLLAGLRSDGKKARTRAGKKG